MLWRAMRVHRLDEETEEQQGGATDRATLDPTPESRNPKPETRNPKPKTSTVQLSSASPEPWTLNPQPHSLNPQPSTLIGMLWRPMLVFGLDKKTEAQFSI